MAENTVGGTGSLAALDASPDPRHLAFLSSTAMEFASLGPQDDVYRVVADRLHSLLGNSIVAVGSFDRQTDTMGTRAIAGVGRIGDTLTRLAGRDLKAFRQTVPPPIAKAMKSGRLLQLEGGVYEAYFGAVPRAATRLIERTFKIAAVLGMGAVAHGECFATVLFCVRPETHLPPRSVIETFVSQAAVTLQRMLTEERLTALEAQQRVLWRSSPDPCVLMTLDGRIVDANETSLRRFQSPGKSLVGSMAQDLMRPEDLKLRPLPLGDLTPGESLVDSRVVRLADGAYCRIEAKLSLLPGGLVLMAGRDVTERRRLERELMETSQRERRAIGRDLHDSLGQHLAGVAFLGDALRARLVDEQSPHAPDAIRIAELLREGVAKTRALARGLSPVDEGIGQGLGVALESLCEHAAATYGTPCECAFSLNGTEPSAEEATHLYLIASEAVSNAMRHGEPSVVNVSVDERDGVVLLRVKDDGKGLTVESQRGEGMGLRLMQYRADLMDATLTVDGAAGGTTVTCSLGLGRRATTPAA